MYSFFRTDFDGILPVLAQKFTSVNQIINLKVYIKRGTVKENFLRKNITQKLWTLTTLSGSVDWFVCLYEHHSVSVAQKNPRFFMELEMSIIWLGHEINILLIHWVDIWKVLRFHL